MDSRSQQRMRSSSSNARLTPTPLNLQTTSRRPTHNGDSPPSTPRGKTAGKGKERMRAPSHHTRPSPRDGRGTFLDDLTPVDTGREQDTDTSRDSHDLSLGNNVTRDSVVDNMLLSLGSMGTFGGGGLFNNHDTSYSGFNDESFFAPDRRYNGNQQPRHRGHTYSSSYSSDYDLRPEDTYRGDFPRSRRSNSSSNFQSGRTDNGRVADLNGNKRSIEAQRAAHARGGVKKGSKSSAGSSSVDFGTSQVFGTTKWGFSHRSASFDYGHTSPSKQATTTTASVLDRGRPTVPINYDHYDAAPTPTIPAGPRRLHSPSGERSHPPQPAYAPPPTPVVVTRKNSVVSSTSNRTNRTRTGTSGGQSTGTGPSSRANALTSEYRDLPPLPTFVNPPAPSPTIAMRKQSHPILATPFTSINNTVKVSTPPASKPGFFKRMFGGTARSNSAPATTTDYAPQLPQPDATATRKLHADPPATVRPSTKANSAHIASQIRQLPKSQLQTSKDLPPQPKEQPPPSSQQQQPTLNKKSSFFRRRKKSISEDARPPVPQIPLPANDPQPYIEAEKVEPKTLQSPTLPSPSGGSLWKAMDPYLGKNDATSPMETYFDSREHQPATPLDKIVTAGNGIVAEPEDMSSTGVSPAGFSPGYTPHKDAAVRMVKPGSRSSNMDSSAPSSRGAEAGTPSGTLAHRVSAAALQSSLRPDSPRLKVKVKRRTSPTKTNFQDDTFLADSSGNEDKASPSGLSPTLSSRSPTFGLPKNSNRPKTSPTSSTQTLPTRRKENQTPTKRTNLDEQRPTTSKETLTGGSRELEMAEAEDDWLLASPLKNKKSQTTDSAKSSRVWIPTSASEERLDLSPHLSLPLEGPRRGSTGNSPTTTNDDFQSATSLPLVQLDGDEIEIGSPERVTKASQEPLPEDLERAQKIFDGDEDFVSKQKAAAWLGESSPASSRTRKAYIQLFDWSGMNVLSAMRDLCSRLVLKGETQQVDRILEACSDRWCECNPNHGFKAKDIVHTLFYSILLLNTDLHVADIEQKMSRAQFVKNTIPTMRRLALDATPELVEDTVRPATHQPRAPLPWMDQSTSSPVSPTFPIEGEERPSLDTKRSRNRLSIRPPMRAYSDDPSSLAGADDVSNALVRAPIEGSFRVWEFQMETILRDMYSSIQKQRLPLHGAEPEPQQPQNNSLSVLNTMLRRTPSVLSKTPSENMSYRTGRSRDYRTVAARWNGRGTARPKMYPTSTVGSSRTSLDDQSVFSPAGSSTWSKYSFGKTGTSMSVDSLSGHFAQKDYQQSIGFANALSQAIIREEGYPSNCDSEISRLVPLLDDDTLELAGPPWAKEGILKHKHHLEAVEKKSKDRNWNECFAVIEKGWIRLFSFNSHSTSNATKSLRLRSGAGHGLRTRPSTANAANHHPNAGPGSSGTASANAAIVGGGNWTENAEQLAAFMLRQSIASALPSPGYSKQRPHVWALSLPTGAVHLFQVGTPEIVREWVSTANYWSARLSKEPLIGGVSNIEYGWSDIVVTFAQQIKDGIRPGSQSDVMEHAASHSVASRPRAASSARHSVQSSLRSSMDHGNGMTTTVSGGAAVMRARLPGDGIMISDWSPPTQSMMASTLMEVDQLKALEAYVENVAGELERHNELRSVISLAFSPRHPNAGKAMTNWERKSSYLLKEIVKFRTYIDSLKSATKAREEIQKEKDERRKEKEEREREKAARAEEDGRKPSVAVSQWSELSQVEGKSVSEISAVDVDAKGEITPTA